MPEEKTITQEIEEKALGEPAAQAEELKCPSTFLIGPPGAGKTTALISYIEAGLDLFVAITDPGGEESLIDELEKKKLPLEKLHCSYIPCATVSWAALIASANKVNVFSYEDLAGIKSGLEPSEHRQFLDLLSLLANFKDARTGEEYGPVEKLGSDCALAIDSLSGVNVMAMDLMVGGKPTAHQGEWGVAMRMEEKFITKVVADVRCFTCITGHTEKYFNEETGAVALMPAMLGRKLAPKVPRLFSDIILAVEEGGKYSWATTYPGADLKARNLPIQDGLDPSFKPIVEKWRSRQAQVGRKSKAA